MISIAPYKELFNQNLKYDLPSVFSHLNSLGHDTAKIISSYLENGLVLFEFVSPIPSVIDKKMVPYVLYSDGKYCWDGMLLHLVRDYSVELPEEFVSHILNSEIFPSESNALDVDKMRKKYMIQKGNLKYLLINDSQIGWNDLIEGAK